MKRLIERRDRLRERREDQRAPFTVQSGRRDRLAYLCLWLLALPWACQDDAAARDPAETRPSDAAAPSPDAFRFHDLAALPPVGDTGVSADATPVSDALLAPDAAPTCVEAECDGVCDRGECLPAGPARLPGAETALYFAYDVHLTLPETDPDCCVDFDGDGRGDNQFGEAMRARSQLAADEFPYETLQQGADRRQYVLLLAVHAPSGVPAAVEVLYGLRLSPALPGPDRFHLRRVSHVEGTGAARVRSLRVEADGRSLHAPLRDPAPLRFDLALEFSIPLALRRSALDLRFVDTPGGVAELHGRWTGAVALADFAVDVNALVASQCGCLALGETPLFGVDAATGRLTCAALPGEAEACDRGDAHVESNCVLLGLDCPLQPGLLAPDVSLRPGGPPDAFSVALTFKARPATLEDLVD